MQTITWIIDDDMVSQFATRYCLEQYGTHLSIETFSSAEEALVEASILVTNEETLPGLIFLDLVMDSMGGWEFIQQLQKIIASNKFPEIYVLSAFAKTGDRSVAKTHEGVSGYFDKPLTRVALDKVFKPVPRHH